MIVRRATLADLSFIMATERLEGYEKLVGRWEEDRHREALGAGNYAYFIGEIDGQPAGFAILRGWNAADRVTLVQRVAIAKPGHGIGTSIMKQIVDIAFRESNVFRLWIGHFTDNHRAGRCYQATGFKPEGITRGSAYFFGVNHDEAILSIIRPEWTPAT